MMDLVSDAVLFDLDRTLVDLQSFTDYSAARRDATSLIEGFDDLEVPPTDWSADTVASMALLVACAGTPHWQRVSDAIERHERAAIPRSVAMPGALEAWALSADLPRAVVTLLPEATARATLAWHGIDTGGVVVVGRRADQRPKPAPDGLLAACAALGVDPAGAVMVGDSSWDREAAAAAGCAFVGVPTRPENLPAGVPTAADLPAAVRLALP